MISVDEDMYLETGLNAYFNDMEPENWREIREQWLALMYGWA